jgi:hypothetical protein
MMVLGQTFDYGYKSRLRIGCLMQFMAFAL